HNPQPHFRNYSTADGLPSPEVYCAFEDSRGYMWFGTDNGAARFDGYTFRQYGSEDGLMRNVVFDIYEDKKGRIWFGTMSGEAFILDRDTITPYPYNHLIQQYKGQFDVAGLAYLQADETAYFDLGKLGFLMIDSLGKDSMITTQSTHKALAIHNFLVLEVPDASRILTSQIDQPRPGAPQPFLHYDFFLNDQRVQRDLPTALVGAVPKIGRLSDGRYLAFGKGQLYCLEDFEIAWSRPDSLSVNEIIEMKDRSIWLCTNEGGGLRYYPDLEKLRRDEFKVYLSGLSISNLLEDSKGGLWVTSQEKGVFYCSDLQMQSYGAHFGFSTDIVSMLAFKDERELFVGCGNGEINRVNMLTDKLIGRFSAPREGLHADLYYESGRDRLWCGGAYYQNGQWQYPKIKQAGKLVDFRSANLKKHQFNAKGEIFAGNNAGFFIIEAVKDRLTYQSFLHIGRQRTNALHIDRRDQLWVGTVSGLYLFKDSMLIAPNPDHPAFSARIEDIDELPDSTLVLATKGYGVVLWKGEKVQQIATQNGLTSNMLEDVHVDEQGVIWVGTLNGLNKITWDTQERYSVRSFTVSNGLPSNEIYQLKSGNGQLWLCTAGGLVRFHELPPNEHTDPPIIEAVVVNGAVSDTIHEKRFRYDQNNFEFRYLAINYRLDGQINYRYRLQAKLPWQHTKNLSVNYPALNPGHYAFEVQAQNEDGFWSNTTAFHFIIAPPWWATWTFRSASGLWLALLAYGLYRYRLNQIKKESDLQQQMIALERSALQAQMNPHFIFNCLNSIQNFILQNDRKQAVAYLARFAKLVRHHLDASVNGKVSLEKEIDLLDHYLALERERFEHRFDYCIKVEEGLLEQDISFPPLLIQPYVENAVKHGLARQPDGGRVEVRFSQQHGHLLVSIIDNGPGFKETAKQHGRHQSVGMSITQKRLELLSQNSADLVKVDTLQNRKKGDTGTEILIQIRTENPAW
ncbi:MAG: histidine kinase, partial [Lewinella sp.]|nr:histidine kinase [Lewinella sp.]